jgi:predicted amidohydrolase
MSVRVAVAQMTSRTADVQANLNQAARFVASAAAQGAQVVVLPEMILTGSVRGEAVRRTAQPVPGPASIRLGQLARAHRVYLATGMLEIDAGDVYNVSLLHGPDGKLMGVYRKWHLFATEKEAVRSGDRPAIFETPFGRIALTICYDLVFPEYVRGLALQGAKLILNGTNWIADRWQAGLGWSGEVTSHMAATRALENGIHIAMANRTGRIDERWRSLGYSCVCAPSGQFLARLQEGEGFVTADLDLNDPEWQKWREVATYLPDRRVDLYQRLEPSEARA